MLRITAKLIVDLLINTTQVVILYRLSLYIVRPDLFPYSSLHDEY